MGLEDDRKRTERMFRVLVLGGVGLTACGDPLSPTVSREAGSLQATSGDASPSDTTFTAARPLVTPLNDGSAPDGPVDATSDLAIPYAFPSEGPPR